MFSCMKEEPPCDESENMAPPIHLCMAMIFSFPWAGIPPCLPLRGQAGQGQARAMFVNNVGYGFRRSPAARISPAKILAYPASETAWAIQNAMAKGLAPEELA